MFQLTRVITLLGCCVLGVLPTFAADQSQNPENSKKHFEINLDEVVISVPMEQKISGASIPLNILSEEELQLKAASSIGETLKLEPGIHSQSFGPGVGLPVIRGQSGPRVRVLSNGLGNNDASQASPDHASGATPLLADRIEVLRGPATLLYGSGAIGGIVNVIDNRIPEQVPEGLVGGALEQRFNSVSDELTTAIKVEGGQDYLAYHVDGFFRDQGDISIGGQAVDVPRAQVAEPGLAVIQNSRGTLRNSASNGKGGSAGFSLVGDSGFIGVSGNRLENNYGIPPEGTANAEVARIALEQNKFDLKSEWNDPIQLVQSVRMHLSFTDYQHREMTDGTAAAFFTNETFEGRVEVPHVPLGPLEGVIGFQAIASEFSAFNIEDGTSFVPTSQINNFGVFATESFNLGPVETQVGVRVEQATLDPQGFDHPFRSFTPISASASGRWDLNEHNTFNLAFTRSQRAPQVQELYFSGEHEATRSFEQGNANLEKETSYNLDLGYRFTSEWVSAEVDLFHNSIDAYIFQQRTGAFIGGAPVVASQQTHATFMGYEAKLVFPLMSNQNGLVDLTLFSDFTRARLVNKGDVPQTPPLRWGFQLDYVKGEWSSNLRLTRAEAQNNPGANESATPDYVLLNLNTHYHITEFQGADILLFAKGNNLLDADIRNSTSFLRNFSPEPGIGAEIGVRIHY